MLYKHGVTLKNRNVQKTSLATRGTGMMVEQNSGPPAWGLGEGLTTPPRENTPVKEHSRRFKKQKRDMRLGTWNVRSLYRVGSLMAAARELARYKLDLVGVQEVRWDKEGTVRAGDCNFFYGKGNGNHQLGTGFLCTKE